VKAWAIGPGKGTEMLEALKARDTEVSLENKLMMKQATPFRAFSAQKISTAPTWANGPGFHISRLWR
jgi:hypothetical protein